MFIILEYSLIIRRSKQAGFLPSCFDFLHFVLKGLDSSIYQKSGEGFVKRRLAKAIKAITAVFPLLIGDKFIIISWNTNSYSLIDLYFHCTLSYFMTLLIFLNRQSLEI